MYRYVKSSELLHMFEDFDLEDFGDLVAGRLKRKLKLEDVIVRGVSIDPNGSGEFLTVSIDVDGVNYEASCILDARKVRKPRDLSAKYAEPIYMQFVDQLNADGIYGASYEMEQEFTSKQTASGNGSFNHGNGRVPSLFKKISWVPGTVNFDYGCGYESTQARIAEYLDQYDVDYIGFDKFHQNAEQKKAAWAAVDQVGGADTCTCANVLNVVKERDVRVNEIIANIYEALKSGGTAYFDVYESDKSSRGGQTGKDNYQLKRPIDGYIEEVSEIFGEDNVKLKGKVIIAKK